MDSKSICFIKNLNDEALLDLAAGVVEELELRGLPDVSYKEGYKRGFLYALRDSDLGPGQVWEEDEVVTLFQELERLFSC